MARGACRQSAEQHPTPRVSLAVEKRKICIITGSRSEYGVLYWLMREVQTDPALELQVAVTGMHLSPAFGFTVGEIERDEMPIAARVEMQLSSDSRVGMTKSLGLGVLGFADALDRLAPDILVVLGDRYESLAAAQAAALAGIPVAHISGGEVTAGAVDEWIRHSITKMSWWHFVAAEPYRRRVIQLGEEPARVFNVGDPGLDSVRRLALVDASTVLNELGLEPHRPFFLVTYHPVTQSASDPRVAFAELLAALDRFPDVAVVMTHPNADAGGQALGQQAEQWCATHRDRARCVVSLGQLRYLSLMRSCEAVLGNSSSGIIEAPALHVATVNMGPRQDGRLKARSIVDCAEDRDAIETAIRHVLTPGFRRGLGDVTSLYGDANASQQIKNILVAATMPSSIGKSFNDLP
jgi:UDP-hydrolysing UDP-N-acetyl-D-glucosamine 2-epimerase